MFVGLSVLEVWRRGEDRSGLAYVPRPGLSVFLG
jgi:hypothetical protein